VPQLPLVRLRVEHSGFEVISGQAFGQQFAERVANPDEVLLFHRRNGGGASGSRKVYGIGDVLEIEEGPMGGGEDGIKIQDIIYKYIEGEQNLQILSEPDLNDAVQAFVHRAEPCAIEQFVKQAVETTNQAVLQDSRAVGQEEVRVQMQDIAESLRQQRLAGGPPPGASLSGGHTGGASSAAEAKPEPVDLMDEDDDLQRPFAAAAVEAVPRGFEVPELPEQLPPARGRGSRGGARGGAQRGAGRGRGVKRSQEEQREFGVAAPPAKTARTQQARALGSEPLGLGAFFGGGASTPSAARAPAVESQAPGGRAAEATPFLPRRSGAAASETPWGDGTAGGPADTPAPANSQRTSAQSATRRQWNLRTPG
ncbi:unnamed protein product, partial [Polarella glacialis]